MFFVLANQLKEIVPHRVHIHSYTQLSSVNVDNDMPPESTIFLTKKASDSAPSTDSVAFATAADRSDGFLIEYDEITIGQKIGQGSFGAVYKGEWRHTAWYVAQIFLLPSSLSCLLPFLSLLSCVPF